MRHDGRDNSARGKGKMKHVGCAPLIGFRIDHIRLDYGLDGRAGAPYTWVGMTGDTRPLCFSQKAEPKKNMKSENRRGKTTTTTNTPAAKTTCDRKERIEPMSTGR